MKDKTYTFTLLAVLVVANILAYFTLHGQSIRLDESQSIWAATKSVPGILEYIAQDVHVPLYPIILHFWMQIFGTHIFTARVLSYVFYLLTLPFLYLFTKESGSHRIALLTVTLFSLSPFVVWYSNEARMYTLFTFVTCMNHLYFLRYYKSQGQDGSVGFWLSALFGLYTHYFFLLVLFTQFVFLIIRALQERTALVQTLVFKYLQLAGTAFVFLTPWFLYVLSLGGAANSQPLITPPDSYALFQTFIQFLFGFQRSAIQSFIVSIWPISLVFLFLIFTHRRQLRIAPLSYFALATLLPIIIVFCISFLRPVFLSRYLILVTPTLFLIIAWILLSYKSRLSFIFTALFIVLLSVMSFVQNTSAHTPVREDYVTAAEYLSMTATSRDIVVVSAPFTVYPIEYSYNGRARIDTIPLWNRYESGAIPPFDQAAFEKQVSDYSKVYIYMYTVLSYDQGYEDDIVQYLDTHYHLREQKQLSPTIQVRVYRLRYDVGEKPLLPEGD